MWILYGPPARHGFHPWRLSTQCGQALASMKAHYRIKKRIKNRIKVALVPNENFCIRNARPLARNAALPTLAARPTLERSNQLGSNPAAIEATRLWSHRGAIDAAF